MRGQTLESFISSAYRLMIIPPARKHPHPRPVGERSFISRTQIVASSLVLGFGRVGALPSTGRTELDDGEPAVAFHHPNAFSERSSRHRPLGRAHGRRRAASASPHGPGSARESEEMKQGGGTRRKKGQKINPRRRIDPGARRAWADAAAPASATGGNAMSSKKNRRQSRPSRPLRPFLPTPRLPSLSHPPGNNDLSENSLSKRPSWGDYSVV